MNINELLATGKSSQRSTGFHSEIKEDHMKLSDFLQYPTLDEPESDTDDIELRGLKVPPKHPEAAFLISRLVEATGTIEVMHILHDAYAMYCDGKFIIDIDADEWPDFWEVVLS